MGDAGVNMCVCVGVCECAIHDERGGRCGYLIWVNVCTNDERGGGRIDED